MKNKTKWIKAHCLTDYGAYEIRLRKDGDYDIRQARGIESGVGKFTIGNGKLEASYVRAEFCIDQNCPGWLYVHTIHKND